MQGLSMREGQMPVIDEKNPYLKVPRVLKPFYSHDLQVAGTAILFGPLKSQSYIGLMDFLN